MRDVLPSVDRWLAAGKRVAFVTVIDKERAGPSPPGTMMAVSEDMEVAGSVSGGCVEPAAIEEALEAIAAGRAKRVTYGISDDEAVAVGLTCGGIVHLLIDPLVDAPE